MTPFWSGWVMALVVLNLGLTIFLFVWALHVRIPVEPDGTTGHIWAHGVLREAVRPLPRWWIAVAIAALLWGALYLVLYPGFGNSRGLLGWTSESELQQRVAENAGQRGEVLERLGRAGLTDLARDPQALALGRTLYQDNCAACHGLDLRGREAVGAPDLIDADWLYGADESLLLASIEHGRNGVMPALGTVLGREGVNQAAAFVVQLSGRTAPGDWAAAGQRHFTTLCTACHGADGRGNAALGAPNLTDSVWLYGGDFAQIVASIRDGRSGVMPAWAGRLDATERRVVAAWILSRGSASPAAP